MRTRLHGNYDNDNINSSVGTGNGLLPAATGTSRYAQGPGNTSSQTPISHAISVPTPASIPSSAPGTKPVPAIRTCNCPVYFGLSLASSSSFSRRLPELSPHAHFPRQSRSDVAEPGQGVPGESLFVARVWIRDEQWGAL